METQADVISFANASAQAAFDCCRDYESLQDAIDGHRENVRDTLKEYRLTQFEPDAFAAYDARVEKLQEPMLRVVDDAIEQSLAAGGAYVIIPDAPGVVDALCDRASNWFDLAIAQREGLAIGGHAESDEWNVFVVYAG